MGREEKSKGGTTPTKEARNETITDGKSKKEESSKSERETLVPSLGIGIAMADNDLKKVEKDVRDSGFSRRVGAMKPLKDQVENLHDSTNGTTNNTKSRSAEGKSVGEGVITKRLDGAGTMGTKAPATDAAEVLKVYPPAATTVRIAETGDNAQTKGNAPESLSVRGSKDSLPSKDTPPVHADSNVPGAFRVGKEESSEIYEDAIDGDSKSLGLKRTSTSRKMKMQEKSAEIVITAEVVDDEKEKKMTEELALAQEEVRRLQQVVSSVQAESAEIVDIENQAVVVEGDRRKEGGCVSYLPWIICLGIVVAVGAVVIGVILSKGGDATVTQTVPTSSPTQSGVFIFNEQLVDAVLEYIRTPRRDSDIAAKYGWPIGNWDVSRITDFSSVCRDERFNEDISGWNVSRGTSFNSMFLNADKFNQDLSNWEVGKGGDFRGMFTGALSFNSSIESWEMESATDLSYMFHRAESFNQDLSKWKTTSVTSMESMFDSAKLFDSDLGRWDVAKCSNFRSMFKFAQTFNRDLSGWNTERGTQLSEMFHEARKFNQNLCSWKESLPTDRNVFISNIFTATSCPDPTSPDLSQPHTPFCQACPGAL